MKLPQSLFPPVELSAGQCTAYEKIADAVVAHALEEYDAFCVTRQLDRGRWKPVRKCDTLTIYGERLRSRDPTPVPPPATPASMEAAPESSFNGDWSSCDQQSLSSTESASSLEYQWSLPQLLGVGRVPGKLEDMIYGALTPTLTHVQIKTAYVDDEIADARILFEIKGPTPAEPLRFLGLKWIIKGHSSVIGTVVRQRDLVYVESVGIATRADGTRIGYRVLRSVDVPECGELTAFSIVRARASTCYLLRQDGVMVDVFMKTHAETNGNVPEAIGLRSTANSLVSVGRLQLAGHHRKIGWELTKRMRDPSAAVAPLPSVATARSRCRICCKHFALLTRTLTCDLCASRVCSKCCEEHKLTLPNPTAAQSRRVKLVVQTTVNACSNCYLSVYRDRCAEELAREEIFGGEYGSVPADDASETHAELQWSRTDRRPQPVVRSAVKLQRKPHVVCRDALLSSTPDSVSSTRAREPVANLMSTPSPYYHHSFASSSEVELIPHSSRDSEVVVELHHSIDGEWTNHDMYARMANLQATAESLYQVTKLTTDSVVSCGAMLSRR